MATSVQSQKLNTLYANGQLEGITESQLESFSWEETEHLIKQCEEIPPHTFQPISEDMRQELLLLINNGVLNGVPEADLKYMTVHTGDALLWSVMSSNINRRELANIAQRRRVRKLLAEGFLIGGSEISISNLTKDTAEQLIREGERNAYNGLRSGKKVN